MPKIAYIDKQFRANTLALIATANEIIEEYALQGYDLDDALWNEAEEEEEAGLSQLKQASQHWHAVAAFLQNRP